jgi:transposase
MAEIARKTKRYPSDLTERIEPLLPKPPRRGRKLAVNLREILNAIRYMARSAGGWRMLPTDFGPWQTVCWWFRRFVRLLLFRAIHDVALMMDREQARREASPSAAVIDSQTVKAPAARARGYDANKKIVGRKRHIAVDTDGRLLMVNLTMADIADSPGAQAILEAGRGSGIRSPTALTTARDCSTRRRSLTSSSRLFAASTASRASRFCRAGGGGEGWSATSSRASMSPRR